MKCENRISLYKQNKTENITIYHGLVKAQHAILPTHLNPKYPACRFRYNSISAACAVPEGSAAVTSWTKLIKAMAPLSLTTPGLARIQRCDNNAGGLVSPRAMYMPFLF